MTQPFGCNYLVTQQYCAVILKLSCSSSLSCDEEDVRENGVPPVALVWYVLQNRAPSLVLLHPDKPQLSAYINYLPTCT